MPNIEEVILAYNSIYDNGAIALSKSKTLWGLELSANRIGYDGAIALSKAKLNVLHITHNYINQEGIDALKNSRIYSLDTRGNFEISDDLGKNKKNDTFETSKCKENSIKCHFIPKK